MAQFTELSEFYPIMKPELRGCSNPSILAALRRAAITFCEDTEAWQEDSDTAIVVDQRQYDVSETNGRVLRLIRVRLVDEDVSDIRDPESGTVVDPWKYELVNDDSTGAETLDFLKAYIPSDEADGYTLVVTRSLAPHDFQDILPDWFMTQWGMAIRSRAFFELYSAPDKPYSNPQQATRYWDQYMEYFSRAKFDNLHRRKYVSERAQSPRWAP